MTKFNSNLYESYTRATARSLSEVYANCSNRKRNAEVWNLEQMIILNGFDFKIVSHNSNFFSCAFQYPDPKTGVLRLFYNTGRNIYDFEVEV